MSNNATYLHDTVICDKSATLGPGVKVWQFSSIQKNAVIGEGCILGQSVNVGPNVSIGKKCKIQNNVSIYEGVELGDYVFCGPSMVFTNIMVPRSKYPQAESHLYLKTTVKEGVSIGANATIVCGVTLGKYSFIGAGTVVINDVPDYAVMVGNPARHIGWMSEAGTPLDFSESETVYCKKSGVTYRYEDQCVTEIND
ncbi:N-acetyltransferase [Candidatus Marinamargulisbacteria bacterium SCGC AG-414-C22]|nr:N-acetyltransferase [Candidatus Marinamargulisbacteria bacterium SCGC AG-414-C22]